jgi:nitrogen regulatory protein P-II 2
MHTTTCKLVTVIVDRLLAEEIADEILERGARGYTITDSRGRGDRGINPMDWEGANVRLETLVPPETADRIIEHLAQKYFSHHGIIAFLQDVQVVRGKKFS